GYFDPSKSLAEGRKGASSRTEITDIAEPPCDAERHEMHFHAERGNENQKLRRPRATTPSKKE
ncbi:hypothetical protein, partial [Pseudomonas syringae]|uniref:hypothetical protein n=1 Tax=Pseudomonas syringae TaxID=317 RepID=UPI001F30F566